MPRRRRTKQPPRLALPPSELESKIMAMLRGDNACAKLKGVDLVYVGSIGQEPNWFARTIPPQVTEACRQAFVTALAKVRKEFDLSPSQPSPEGVGLRIEQEHRPEERMERNVRLGDPKEAYAYSRATCHDALRASGRGHGGSTALPDLWADKQGTGSYHCPRPLRTPGHG
jgi:hypothetical protein